MKTSISKAMVIFALMILILSGSFVVVYGTLGMQAQSSTGTHLTEKSQYTLSGLHISITPSHTYEYTGESYHIFVNSTKGYSNYSAVMYLSANDVTGLSPSAAKAIKSSTGYFEFNITAPSVANQTVYGLICVKATYKGTPVSASSSFTSAIYDPITLYASIMNTASVAYSNIPVGFYVNGGKALGIVDVKEIAANSRKTVNITIPANLVSQGKNTLEVSVVPGSAQAYSGISKYTETFYYGHPPNYSWFYYIVAIVVIFMVFLTVTSATGRRTKQPKWRTRKTKEKKIAKK